LSPPYFFGVDIFCTNAHGIHWIIGANFVEFSQSILMKIIKIVATRCQILRLKCIKFNFSWGSLPRPCSGSLQRSPNPLAGFKEPTSKGTGGKRREWKQWRGPLYFILRIYAHGQTYSHKDDSTKDDSYDNSYRAESVDERVKRHISVKVGR